MSNDIYPIYHNSFGIAFQWKRQLVSKGFNKIQMVFRDMGFYLTLEEIQGFKKNIEAASVCKNCNCCNKEGRYILLKTPSDKIDIAVSEKELSQVEDLIKGTLFQLQLDTYIKSICAN